LERFGGKNITWGLSECPVIDERAVYAIPGGRRALAVAIDKRSGEVIWQSEPLAATGDDAEFESASYVSPILIRFNGRRLLVGCSLRHLVAIDADTGKLQWTTPRPTQYSVLAMSPVLTATGLFMAAPHGSPGSLFELIAPGEDGKVG